MEWMHRYGIGFGLMGEQGIEAIHSKYKYVLHNICLDAGQSSKALKHNARTLFKRFSYAGSQSHRQSDE